MEFTLEELKLLLTGTSRLLNECYRIENDYHGQQANDHLTKIRSRKKTLMNIQRKLVDSKTCLENQIYN